MLNGEAQMNWKYNVKVCTANWFLLAGYFPSPFTWLKRPSKVKNSLGLEIMPDEQL
jgi:hypothetical protein